MNTKQETQTVPVTFFIKKATVIRRIGHSDEIHFTVSPDQSELIHDNVDLDPTGWFKMVVTAGRAEGALLAMGVPECITEIVQDWAYGIMREPQ